MTTDQIAAEAFNEMKAAAWTNSISDQAFISIIKAACEKAYLQGREDEHAWAMRAAQASEKK